MSLQSVIDAVTAKLAGPCVGQRVRHKKYPDQVGRIIEIYREGKAAMVLFDNAKYARGYYLWALEPVNDDS